MLGNSAPCILTRFSDMSSWCVRSSPVQLAGRPSRGASTFGSILAQLLKSSLEKGSHEKQA